MKRSPLCRRTPLHRGGWLARRTPLRSVSAKRAKVQQQRRTMVREELARRELCEAGAMIRFGGYRSLCAGLAVDLHEPLTRARGGSILDPANTVAVCRSCHDWIHDHPKAAAEVGLLRSR